MRTFSLLLSRQLQDFFLYTGGVGLLAIQILRNLAIPPHYFRLVVHEIDSMGVRSLPVAVVAATFTGMVMVLQTAYGMAKFGAELYVGSVVALALLRELGPVLTAILVGGRVASGITAEIGSMKETEQIDALRVIGANYIKRLLVPKVLAALLIFPLLTAVADIIGIVGGAIVAVWERNLDWHLYFNTIFQLIVMQDLLSGLGKTIFFAFFVVLIGCYNGLTTGGGTAGIGHSTTSTVVTTTLGIIVSDFFLTKLFFLFW